VTGHPHVCGDCGDPLLEHVCTKLKKIYWQRDLATRGHERNGMSPELSEALRNEIRTALEASGGPFDVNVARRVYDLAMAARDMCVVATDSVKEAIDQVKDTNGPMETLDSPSTPESAVQASESFGARLFREIMALVPTLRSGDDPKALVHALAEARARGMHDVAEELEVKLFGRVLSEPKPVDALADCTVIARSRERGIEAVVIPGFEDDDANGATP
jgi:hypothetical protein